MPPGALARVLRFVKRHEKRSRFAGDTPQSSEIAREIYAVRGRRRGSPSWALAAFRSAVSKPSVKRA